MPLEHADAEHELFERIPEPPLLVGGEEVVRRHRDGDASQLRGAEQLADVGHSVIVANAVPEHRPRDSVGAEEIDLWVGDDECGV